MIDETDPRRQPPRLARALLAKISERDIRYAALGDFEEIFNRIAREAGPARARSWYWSQVLRSIPSFINESFYWSVVMLRNYFLVALRNLKKHKSYSLINILGLSVGMACCILIGTYILNELSYDRYHEKSDRIFRLVSILTLGDKPNDVATTNFPPALAMRNDYPEVVNSVRIVPYRKVPVKYGNRQFYEERIYYAEETVFDVFTFPLLKGDPGTALTTAHSVVIAEDMARKYFGAEDPLGKVLKFNNRDDFTVTGVMEKVPSNSHFEFDMLCSFQTFLEARRPLVESWASYFGCFSFVLLAEGTDYRELEKKLPGMKQKYFGDSLKGRGVDVDYFLQPLTAIHLHSHRRHEISGNSDIKYVYIFAAVAVFILLMACINFMNLATARAATRAREIGMRKVLGADKAQIMRQFFGESIFYSIISFIFALLLVHLTLPLFSSLSDRALTLDYAAHPWIIPVFIALVLLVGLVAGSYPALYLSGFNPVRVLTANSGSSRTSSRFRRTLVVAQFAISISLIIATFTIINQLDYMKNMDLGFDQEQVVVLPVMDRNIAASIESIKSELVAYHGIISAAASSHVPGGITSGASLVPEGYADGQAQMMNVMSVDCDYISTLGMEIVRGRNFSPEFTADTSQALLVNEAAVAAIGWDDPLGKTIHFSADPDQVKKTVVGVVKDHHYVSPHIEIEPLYIDLYGRGYRTIFVRIEPDDIPTTLAHVENVWKRFDPHRPFDFYFLDESYNRQYRVEEKLRGIFFNFTFLAIIIACLGLFGLASFAAQQRVREIGIRKVLGASVPGIVLLLSREFSRWVLAANIIAWPLAWYAMNRWLRNFAYHTDLSWTVFVISGVLALLIAVGTISFQAVKVAHTDPAKSLRYE
ncbi:MAG: ABC transporter permease [Candidatus Krumholzibacteriota bacterium]|nr:ABC transporter permease [Candidatus Krumholzibacteriota bacterium]